MNEWKEVTLLEAVAAFVAGTHEVERSQMDHSIWFVAAEAFYVDNKYRIRKKAPMITVTIPMPCGYGFVSATSTVGLIFDTAEDFTTAYATVENAINAMKEQQP